MLTSNTCSILSSRVSGPGRATLDPGGPGPAAVPLERLEAQICELAGHLAAATCRFLVLLGDFDARRGWASWDMSSCAAWLSWKCQMSAGAAREHVRVARACRFACRWCHCGCSNSTDGPSARAGARPARTDAAAK